MDDAPKPLTSRRSKKRKGFEDVPMLSREEVERRVDMRPSVWPADVDEDLLRNDWVPADPVIPGAMTRDPADTAEEATLAPAAAAVVEPGPTLARPAAVRGEDDRADDRRRILWRDSATILIGVIVAILAAQTFLPGVSGGPDGSATPLPSGVAVGTLPPPVSLAPGDTFGPIIDPSLGVDATPTPIPVITLGPPTPSPSPSPSLEPSASVKPTPKPSKTPTPSRTPTPTAGPTPPPPTPAPPVAAFSWDPPNPIVGELVTFTNTSTGATTSTWTFGDGDGSSAENPTHIYADNPLTDPDDYIVTLTVTGPGGFDVVSHTVTVVLPPP